MRKPYKIRNTTIGLSSVVAYSTWDATVVEGDFWWKTARTYTRLEVVLSNAYTLIEYFFEDSPDKEEVGNFIVAINTLTQNYKRDS